MKVNENFTGLSENYLFADIAKKVKAFKMQAPDADVISLGIGDVTQPLAPAVIKALHKAADEMYYFTRAIAGSRWARLASSSTGSASCPATSTRFPNRRPRSTPGSATSATCWKTWATVATWERV